AAADHDLHSLGAEAESRFHGLLHRPAEGDAPLELAGDGLRHELGVELRPLDLLNVDVDLAAHTLLEIVPQLVHLGAPAADDDARPRGVDGDAQLVGGPLDVDLRHSGVAQASLELAAQLQILVQGGGVVGLAVPARVPGLVVDEPEPIRVCFLTHSSYPLKLLLAVTLAGVQLDRDVALPPQDTERPAHRCGTDPLCHRPAVDEDLLDVQAV